MDHALRDGFDYEHGGLYLEGPVTGPADKKRKEWWQQTEALVGTLNAYQLTGDSKYWKVFELEASYILDGFVDRALDFTERAAEIGDLLFLFGDLG